MRRRPYDILSRDYQGKIVNHLGFIRKVIPLNLFLDMVLSSNEDVIRAMRGQLKRLLRRNGGKVIFMICLDFQTFHSRDVYCNLRRLFV